MRVQCAVLLSCMFESLHRQKLRGRGRAGGIGHQAASQPAKPCFCPEVLLTTRTPALTPLHSSSGTGTASGVVSYMCASLYHLPPPLIREPREHRESCPFSSRLHSQRPEEYLVAGASWPLSTCLNEDTTEQIRVRVLGASGNQRQRHLPGL